MDINSIPESLQSKFRIAVIAALMTGPKTFRQIKELTDATDGNLSVHMSRLEELGYIDVKKEFIAKRPCTTYGLTELGKKHFKEYVELLEKLINNAR
jgi:DNA-binding HxlR family transcriptional regulator